MKHVKKIASLLLAVQSLSGCLEPAAPVAPETHASKRALIKYVIPATSATQNQLVHPMITNCIDNVSGRQIGKEFCLGLIHPTKNLCAGQSTLQDKVCDPTALKNSMAALEAAYDAAGTIPWATFSADQALHAGKVVEVSQADFASGTLRIKQPCKIKFLESVEFNPNSAGATQTVGGQTVLDPARSNDWFPKHDQSEYSGSAFRVGFFAALTLESDGIIVDLNGQTLKAHKQFALMQQFYSNIELSDLPFDNGGGPLSFGPSARGAKDVLIKNGTLGLSSHHGIHGNNAENVLIKDMTIKDYTVGGVSLNGSKNVQILGSNIESNIAVPVYGGFSSIRFDTKLLQGFRAAMLASYDIFTCDGTEAAPTSCPAGYSDGPKLSAAYNAAQTAISVVFTDVANDVVSSTGQLTPMSALSTNDRAVLRNKIRFNDTSSYGIVINPKGNATGPFLENLMTSSVGQPSNVFIARTHIAAVVANPMENLVLSAAIDPAQESVVEGKDIYEINNHQRGSTGSNFNFKDNFDLAATKTVSGVTSANADFGIYKSNVIADLQVELAALQKVLPSPMSSMLGEINIDSEIIKMKRDALLGIKQFRLLPKESAIPADLGIGDRVFVVVDTSSKPSQYPLGTPVERSFTVGGTPENHPVEFAVLGNGDIQFHVLKGIFGIRADGVDNLTLVDVEVGGVLNHSVMGFSPVSPSLIDTDSSGDGITNPKGTIGWSGPLDGGHPGQGSMLGYFGNHARGISISASQNVRLENVSVHDIKSQTGPAWGVEIKNHSDSVKISGLNVSLITGNGVPSGGSAPYRRPTFGTSISPNWNPEATPLEISETVTNTRIDSIPADSSVGDLSAAPWLGLP